MKSSGSTSAFFGRLFLGVCACISLYLASIALGRTALPGCDTGSACQEALESPWAFVFGMPVSFVGLLLYSFTLLRSEAFVRRDRSAAGLQAGMAISAVVAGAVWFSAVQVFALSAMCVWCWVNHACGIAGALLLCHSRNRHAEPAARSATDLLRDPRRLRTNARAFRFAATGAALAGTGMLALGALSGPLYHNDAVSTSPDALPPPPPRSGSIPFHGGRFHVNPDEFPVIGHPAPAERTVLFFTDYTSARCRRTHVQLEALIASSARAHRVVVMPAALSLEAEDLQRALLTLFHADRNKWRSLSALLTSGQISAERRIVEQIAIKFLGAEKWAEAVFAYASQVDEQIALTEAILMEGRSGAVSPALPQLMRGTSVLADPEPNRARLAAFFSSDDLKEAPAGGAATGPVLFVVDPRITIDDLQPGVPREFLIRVRNDGTQPLKLGWLALDADCEVTQRPDNTLEPGESSAIGFQITPPSQSTEFTRTLKIHSTAPGDPGIVTIHGKAAQAAASASPSASPRAAPSHVTPARTVPQRITP